MCYIAVNNAKVTILSAKQIFPCLLLVFSSLFGLSQGHINGKLTDDKGAPVSFASVTIKHSHSGVQTDASGKFTLFVKRIPATITCSAVGYISVEKKISKSSFKDSVAYISIIMKAAENSLDEVVVIGYGSRDDDASYSAYAAPSRVKKSLRMEGKTSGLSVSRPSPPPPPAISVRGESSVSKTKSFSRDETAGTLSKEEEKGPSGLHSRQLTAGEVNDFKKWKMWEDYNETDFRIHSDKWKLYATERYSVQVQNSGYKAITGKKVYLISKSTSDTIWRAVSDNTGKAELWNGFRNTKKENDLFIAVENESTKYSAIPFAQGVNRIVINSSCAVSNKVEIAFVVDATGSMGDEITYLKEELEDILQAIPAKDPSIDLHTGAVFYRDKGDAYITKMQQLSAGITNTIQFIKQQAADGGGDYPEEMNEGLNDAVEKMNWSADARTKIIFLLMDAPPHDEAAEKLAVLIQHAAAKGIRMVPVACSGTDKATEFIMRSMALASNGTYLFLTDDSGIGESHIKPTTDEFKVELLNDLLQRVIEQMCFVNSCEAKSTIAAPIISYTNPEHVTVFPNPSSGPVTLKTDKELKEIFVTDFTGKILMHVEVKNKKQSYDLDLSAFPSATYFIRYITADNKTGAEKLVLIR